jgi:hypothetical protein
VSLCSFLGSNSAQQANEQMMAFNREEAEKNRTWQERMANTAHQRETEDLIAAGLNPILSATGGTGAATPSGSSAQVAHVEPTVKAENIRGIAQDVIAAKRFSEIDKQVAAAQVEEINSRTASNYADINKKNKEADAIQWQVENLKADTILKTEGQTPYYKQQGLYIGGPLTWKTGAEQTLLENKNQTEYRLQDEIKARIDKIKADTSLSSAEKDVKVKQLTEISAHINQMEAQTSTLFKYGNESSARALNINLNSDILKQEAEMMKGPLGKYIPYLKLLLSAGNESSSIMSKLAPLFME